MPTHLFCPEAHFVDYRITGLSARNLAAAYHPHPELPDAE